MAIPEHEGYFRSLNKSINNELLFLGNINEARNILRTFEECVLGLAMVRLRRVSLERRHGNMEEAEYLLQDAIKNAKSNNESSFYAIKLARHLFKIQKNFAKSRRVLLEAIERDRVCICIF